MTVLDVFSWLSEKEIGIEEIENIFLKSYKGIADNTYEIVHEISENTETDMIDCKNELLSEGKKVADKERYCYFMLFACNDMCSYI